MAKILLSEIRETEVESIHLVSVDTSPDGCKGDVITIGQFALEVLPTAVPSLIALVQAWIMREHGRTVKFKGKEIEVEGSPEELDMVLETLNIGKKKKE